MFKLVLNSVIDGPSQPVLYTTFKKEFYVTQFAENQLDSMFVEHKKWLGLIR